MLTAGELRAQAARFREEARTATNLLVKQALAALALAAAQRAEALERQNPFPLSDDTHKRESTTGQTERP